MNTRFIACLGLLVGISTLPLLKASPQQDRRASGQQTSRLQSSHAGDPRHIEARITQELAASRSLAGSNITAKVEGKTVTLEGTVESEAAKRRAEGIAGRVDGVDKVDNRLRVDKTMADRSMTEVDDNELAKQVAQKLQQEVLTDAKAKENWFFGWSVEGRENQIDVNVDDGSVELTGEARSLDELTKIVRTVRSMPGVASVRAELKFEEGRSHRSSERED